MDLASSRILLTGGAGLLAGAGSMAAGEYISVTSQRETLEQQIALERAELEIMPDTEEQELAAKTASARKSLIGSGDRSERIRTYNFPQGRVTDHRIGLTVHALDRVLEGDLDDIVDALVAFERAEQLANA